MTRADRDRRHTRVPGRAGRSPSATFAALAVATGLFLSMQSLVSPALPTVQHDLGTTQSDVTWVLTAWLVAAVITTPIVAMAGDLAGKRRMLVVALTAVAVGCLGSAVAPGVGVLVASRAVQGLGGAVLPLSFGIIRDVFPAPRVPTAIGGISAAIAVGGGVGTMLAGPIVESLGWRWAFWLSAFVAGAIAVVTRLVVPESPVRARGRVPALGSLLLAGWLTALLLPISEGSAWGWSSPATVVPLAAAIPLLALWLLVDGKARRPMIDLRLLRLPGVWTANLIAFLVGIEQYSMLAFLPQFAQTPAGTGYGIGASATEAGLLLSPLLMTMAMGSLASGWLTGVVGTRTALALGSAASAASAAALVWWHARAWQVAVCGAGFGLGLGVTFATTTGLVVASVPAGHTAVATGMNSNIRNLSGAIGTAVMSAVVTAGARADGLPVESGYTTGFAMLALTCLAAVGVCVFVPQHPAEREPPPALAPDRR